MDRVGKGPRDLISVVKAQTFHFTRKKFFGEGCFASAVAMLASSQSAPFVVELGRGSSKPSPQKNIAVPDRLK
jgi:hypothetical protein